MLITPVPKSVVRREGGMAVVLTHWTHNCEGMIKSCF